MRLRKGWFARRGMRFQNPLTQWGRRRATILILTLWIVLVLTLLAHSLAFEIQVESKLTSTYRDQFRAEQLARIGIARAVTDLRNDRLVERPEEAVKDINAKEPFDALGDIWTGASIVPRSFEVQNPDPANSAQKVEGEYELLVIDEESKIGLNNSKEGMHLVLKFLLMQLEVDEKDADEIAYAIKDWQDPDDEVSVPEALGESERVYYAKLRNKLAGHGRRRREKDSESQRDFSEEDKVFYPKNAPFSTTEELMKIPGITEELYYGYDPDKDPEPEFFPTRSLGKKKRNQVVGLRDLVTARSLALNVNTASYECLAAVFGAAAGELKQGCDLADTLIKSRQGGKEDGIDNDKALTNLNKLTEVSDFTAQILANANKALPLTVLSDHFTIYSRAFIGKHKESSHSSVNRNRVERPLPSARIVAECTRKVLQFPIYDVQEGDRESTNADDFDTKMPAYKGMYVPKGGRAAGTAARGASTRAANANATGVATEAWFVPVVYFKRWNSY